MLHYIRLHQESGTNRPRRGFTLVEMLVVIAMVMLLAALLLPVLSSARAMARKKDCQSRLRQIGQAMIAYVDAHGTSGRYPDVGQMPSLAPGSPTLMSVLGPYVQETKQVFGCPMDEVYYPKEGISYEYRAVTFAGKTIPQSLSSPFNPAAKRSSYEVIMMTDFDPFHGVPNQEGARNALYADGHVEPL